MTDFSNKHKKLINYFRYHFPWQFVMLVLFVLSGFSNKELPDLTFRIWDKLLHFLAFGFLGVLIYRSFIHCAWGFIRKHAIFFSVIITVLYGAFDEIHQYYVPGRDASYSDWIADAIGAIVFILMVRWIYSFNKQNQNNGKLDRTGR